MRLSGSCWFFGWASEAKPSSTRRQAEPSASGCGLAARVSKYSVDLPQRLRRKALNQLSLRFKNLADLPRNFNAAAVARSRPTQLSALFRPLLLKAATRSIVAKEEPI
jgi:hypothetical protein